VFNFATGKLHRKYDETAKTCQQLQRSGVALYHLDDIDFGRRMALEKELDAPDAPAQSLVFDDSGNFVLYPTLFGIKGVSLVLTVKCAVLTAV
jgi:peptidylprolyl isomerase domain and WD repeat-containing protein 1